MELDGTSYPRVVCRYGRGCTHMDPMHKEQFWHPPVQVLSTVKYHTHYICNECGVGFDSLPKLQVSGLLRIFLNLVLYLLALFDLHTTY